MNKTNEELATEISALRDEISQLKALLGIKGAENTALPDLICNSLTVVKDGETAVAIRKNGDGTGQVFLQCRDGQRLTINGEWNRNAVALYGKNTNASLFVLGASNSNKSGELNLFTLEKKDETPLESRVNLRIVKEGGAISLYNSKGIETTQLYGIQNGSFMITDKKGKVLGQISAASSDGVAYFVIENGEGKVRIQEGKIEILDATGTIIAHLP